MSSEIVNLKLKPLLKGFIIPRRQKAKRNLASSLAYPLATPSEDTNCVPGVIKRPTLHPLADATLPTPMTRIHDTKNSRGELVIILEGEAAEGGLFSFDNATVVGFGFFLERQFMGG